MHKHIALGSPSITFSLVDQTMEGAFEGVSGLVGFARALGSITTALSTGAAFQGVKVTVPSLPLMHNLGIKSSEHKLKISRVESLTVFGSIALVKGHKDSDQTIVYLPIVPKLIIAHEVVRCSLQFD